jgi:hypothetical protein
MPGSVPPAAQRTAQRAQAPARDWTPPEPVRVATQDNRCDPSTPAITRPDQAIFFGIMSKLTGCQQPPTNPWVAQPRRP